MDFYGQPVRVLENEFLRLEYLEQAGPRIVRLFLAGTDFNLFAEMPDFVVTTAFGDYHFTGGHRLWHSPEQLPRTYIPDDQPVNIQVLPNGVRLVQEVEAATGIRKSIEILLNPGSSSVSLHHRLENEGLWAVRLAPWAITQMIHGGVAILPQQAPSDPRNGLGPDRVLAVWPYTNIQDARLHLADDLILVDGMAAQPACKIGVFNHLGWMGYLNRGILFLKRFTPLADQPHVDYGCNNEVYVDHRFLEVETLGALVMLEPGQSVIHTETWELTGGLDYPQTPDGIRSLIADLNLHPFSAPANTSTARLDSLR